MQKRFFIAIFMIIKTHFMTKLEQLKQQLESVENFMPKTHNQLKEKNKSLFLISREIEQIENPKSYAENINHWEEHELRM